MIEDLFSEANLARARAQRDVGMAAAADAADRRSPRWTEQAFERLVEFAKTRSTFAAEELTMLCEREGFSDPKRRRAWGAVYLRAQREGIIWRSSERYARAYGHAAPGLKWRSLVYDSSAFVSQREHGDGAEY